MVLSAGARLGPYEVLGVAGKGGMGEVYRARDTRLGRVVALKVLPADASTDPDRRRRLEQEARVISSLSEPHICTLYDIGQQDGLDYLVMEFLEGDTLQQRLLSGPLPRDQVLRHGREIAAALGKAHRIGIVHRDLKPGNIMLTKSGATLLDFGLARAAKPSVVGAPGAHGERATETIRITSEGAILGTWQYMAPEQVEGQESDARTDIFALGAMLYEMATGRPAFSAKSKAGLIAAILSATPLPVSSQQSGTPPMGPAFDRLVQRCLEKDPEARWQSATDVALELDWIASAEPPGAVAAPAGPARTRREGIAWLLAGVATVAAVSTGFLYARAGHLVTPLTIRLSILPPPRTSFGEVALSPDGKRVAFTVSGGKDRLGIWIRPLDSTAAQLLPDTAGAGSLFWSPDSRYVGFIDNETLKRVEAGGGAPDVLCQLSSVPAGQARATWSADGVVLISTTVYRPLQQLTLSDCSIKTLGELDVSRKEIGQSNPVFLPDGRHFLWVSNRLLPEKGLDVFVGALGSDARTLLVHNASHPSFVAPGYLVFAREGKLLAQAFDANELRLSGEPFPLASERVRTNHFDGMAAYSIAATGALVYLADAPVSYQLQWRDHAGASLGVVAEPDFYRLIQLSPDGKSILAARLAVDTGTEDLWIYDLVRSSWRRFTFDRQLLAEARWSPDSREIVYMTHRGGQFGIYLKSVDREGADAPLLQTAFWRAPRALSPDQRFLLFENSEAQTGFDLWELPLNGGGPATPLVRTTFDEGDATFSPNGRWVGYVSNKSGRDEIYVMAFPGGAQEWKISSGVAGHIGGGSDIAMTWRADGQELFYTSEDSQEMAVPVVTAGDFRAGAPVPLFQVPPGAQVAASPDGRRFLLNVPRDSGQAVPLTVVLNRAPGQPAN